MELETKLRSEGRMTDNETLEVDADGKMFAVANNQRRFIGMFEGDSKQVVKEGVKGRKLLRG